MLINYVTNLDVNEYSGGWSGMNHHIFEQLSREFKINLVQKVNPPVHFSTKLLSKVRRSVGIRGQFPSFSEERLSRIKNEVEAKLDSAAKLTFYHGSTPWLNVSNKIPYAVYLDCCFASYIKVYHNQQQFSATQLNYLFTKEASFLASSRAVFFSSNWALQDAIKTYNLKISNFFVAGVGGAELPATPASDKKDPYFLFVALDFKGKGGNILIEAFKRIQQLFPTYTLKIVGERPPDAVMSRGIEYLGRFNKSKEAEATKLSQLFSQAFCFVLPTSRDMTPLVLIESLSAGCPVITTRNFGIPEIVKHRENGLLLDWDKPGTEQLFVAMKEMITNNPLYERCAGNARPSVRSSFTWQKVGDTIISILSEEPLEWNQ